jgi:ATP-dependent DNA helicase RecG
MPDPSFLRDEVQYLKGVGPKRADVLEDAAGVRTVRDLLWYLPRRYLDRSTVTPVRELRESTDPVTVVGEIHSARTVKGRNKKRYEVVVRDPAGGRMKATWFQGLYWIRKVFEPGEPVAFHGKVQKYGRTFSMTHPDFDKLSGDEANLDTGRIVALYPGGKALDGVGLTSRSFRKIIYNLFKEHGLKLPNLFPEDFRDEYGLMKGRVALRAIHFPKSQKELKKARRRLKFEEFFFIQLLLRLTRETRQDEPGLTFEEPGEMVRRFLGEVLPFELTSAQKTALREITDDVQTGHQMNRLIQGDVGSGKTVVAVAAMLQALDTGYQSAFMAPTEILAEQHFANLKRYLYPLGIDVRLLVGGQKKSERDLVLEDLAAGRTPVVVGTHALIQESVEFDRLGLAVVDEQHRFGVMQRAEMFQKGDRPHMLLMTATPIPRSLAMTLYGDLDVSVIDEMPAGRKPVETKLYGENRRGEMHSFLKDRLEEGEQAYVVYPLVEESEKMDLRDAENGYENLSEAFPDYSVDLVHGRMSSSAKDAAMESFADGETDILVATTVIEVGVDVPTATVMVIEHAERFGLSQLHQLRGRVGRSERQSYCLLVAGHARSAEGKKRLSAMTSTTDGFEISEIDLKLRGAGEFFGTRQSGLPDLKIADITEDEAVLQEARQAAFALIDGDPELDRDEHALLRDHFERYYAKRKLGFARVG